MMLSAARHASFSTSRFSPSLAGSAKAVAMAAREHSNPPPHRAGDHLAEVFG